MAKASQANTGITPEFDPDTLRINTYSLLAGLLRRPPDQALLNTMSAYACPEQPQDALGQCWLQLRNSAREANPSQLDDEYHDLFVGIGHGEVIPYGSWYQTGYLMDKPLARLRQDLASLGITRQQNIYEPEDHIAAVFESMAILIDSAANLSTQQNFFHEHLQCWVARCFRDIEQAPSAHFYQSVAILGRHFFDLEVRYLDL